MLLVVLLPTRFAIIFNFILIACVAPEGLLLHTAFGTEEPFIAQAFIAALGELVFRANTLRHGAIDLGVTLP